MFILNNTGKKIGVMESKGGTGINFLNIKNHFDYLQAQNWQKMAICDMPQFLL